MEVFALISILGCFAALVSAVLFADHARTSTAASRMVSIPALPPIAAVADELDTYEVSPTLDSRLAA